MDETTLPKQLLEAYCQFKEALSLEETLYDKYCIENAPESQERWQAALQVVYKEEDKFNNLFSEYEDSVWRVLDTYWEEKNV